eukprot:UN03887
MERDDLIEFMNENASLSLSSYNIAYLTGDKFNKDKQCLERGHIAGIHHWKRVNIVIILYNELCDNFDLDIFYKQEYESEEPLFNTLHLKLMYNMALRACMRKLYEQNQKNRHHH